MEQNTEGVQVGPHIDRFAADEFGGAIPEFAGCARIGEAAQLSGGVGTDGHQPGVQVAVNDAQAVRVLEGTRDLGQPGQDGLSLQVAGLPELLRQGLTVGERFDAAGGGAVDSEVEDAGDAIVLEPLAGGGAIQESRLCVGSLGRPDVDRGRRAVGRVAGQIGSGSSVGLETADDFEVADSFAHGLMRRS